MFFDWDIVPATDQIYYFDDVVIKGAGTAMPGTVDFTVDMNNFTGSFTQMYVSGTFNGWSGDAHPMDDSDGDGIWTASIPDIQPGAQEFKFTADNWALQEEFGGATYSCTVTDGTFTNSCLLYTSPSPRDRTRSRMPSSA